MVIRKGYADTPVGQIHYRTTGSAAGVPIVLLHQTASSSASYERLMPLLSQRHTVYALDTPGFGQSFDPESVPDLDYLIRALLDALSTLGVETCHVFGHHTGACLGVEMAARYPERVASLALSGPLPMTPEQQREYHTAISHAFSPEPTGAYLVDTWKYLADHGADRDLDVIHREVLDHVRAWRSRALTYDKVWFQDFAGFLEAAACPVLLMCADDDLLWPFFARAREIRPEASAVVIPSASNFAADYQPRFVAERYLAFLSSVRGAVDDA
jgi:pimeloyl-ACP methyl ester carboxylesterase